MWIYDFAFCCEFGKMSQIHVFRGVRPDYYDITLYLYYVIYGRPRINRRVSSGEWLWLLWILWMIVEDCDPLLNSKWSHLVSTENVILTREQVAVSPTPTKKTWRSFLTTGRTIHQSTNINLILKHWKNLGWANVTSSEWASQAGCPQEVTTIEAPFSSRWESPFYETNQRLNISFYSFILRSTCIA